MAKAKHNIEESVTTSGFWRLAEWTGIVMYGVLIAQYISLWVNPGPNDGAKITTLTGMVLFEFVLGHSGVFMALFPKRVALFVFVPFYGIFAWAMSASLPGNSIIILYCGVILLRMRFIFSDPSEDAKLKSIGLSIVSVILFMFCAIGFSSAAGNIPKLGLTPAYLEAIDFSNIANSAEDFSKTPHAAMAMGATYFTILAFFEIWIFGLLKKRKQSA